VKWLGTKGNDLYRHYDCIKYYYYYYYLWGGTESLGICSSPKVSKPWYCGYFGLLYKPQMIDEDDFWSNWWNEIWQGKPKYRRKPTPAPLCPPQNPTWQTRSRTPDRSGGKPATNRLSYGTAFFSPISSPLTTRRFTVEVFDPASTRV
jgi:hypothetical protein